MEKQGRVFLVGSGPGDPELITIKGVECLKRSDVVVYDRLVSERLLQYIPSSAEIIYAGKGPEHHTMAQEAINELLVEKAGAGFTVTRLKGGDPFVFGRGGEEAEALQARGIPFEIVPGVTSAVAGPAYAGIPVTHRGLSSSLAIVTGHEDPTKQDSDLNWDKLSTATDTICFLMGVGNLSFIVDRLAAGGRDPQTPVALVRYGTRANQETLTGTLGTIVRQVNEKQFRAPAVIVVGEVVKMRNRLQWFEQRPLFGRRIMVTRPQGQAHHLSARIEELGGEAVICPAIKIVPPPTYEPLDLAIKGLEAYDWVIFTSINGVEFFFQRLCHHGKDVRALAGLNICAIGPGTAEGLSRRGLLVDLVPGRFLAEGILDALKKQVEPGQKVLLPRAGEAREILPLEMQQMGLDVNTITAYVTEHEAVDTGRFKEHFLSSRLDAVTFTSSSTVQGFAAMLNAAGMKELPAETRVACIGPITANKARELGFPVHVEAEEYTTEGLVQALVENLASAE